MTTASISSYRVAEKFTVLNDRLIGILKRLYFMKQELNSNEKPLFLPGGDKIYESALKTLCKKFPSNENKFSNSSLQLLLNIHEDILNRLSSYFYTLVDIAEIKRPIFELLEIIRKFNVQLDISINFELTKNYLEMVTNFSIIQIMLSKITEVKPIMALFNFAYEYKTGEQEKHIPLMLERLLETQPEKILKTLYGDFNPFSRFITSAIRSLSSCFTSRLVRSQNWTDVKFLDILHEPDKLSHTALTDRMCTQLLSVEIMERWIIICGFFIHPELNNNELYNVWKAAYKNSYVLVLYRDEVIPFHSLAIQFFDSIKNYNKRITEIKEFYQSACSQSPVLHRDRRNYLRLTLRQLCQIISDEPGLLGPKSFLVLWSLSYATDEIHWLLRHSENVPPKKTSIISLVTKVNIDDFNDALLPELLYYVEEIRRLMLRFSQVIQVFYLQILSEYDAPALRYNVKDILQRCGQESINILTSMIQTLASVDSYKDHDQFNFVGIRMDWFRMQIYLSIGNSSVNLWQNLKLISHINSTIFHTKMIDFLNETVKECTDLSIFCFYDKKFNEFYERNITYSTQHRFTIVFPLICSHYINACCDFCPEECAAIAKRATQNAHKCLKNITQHIAQLVSQTMDTYFMLAMQLLPKEAVNLIPQKINKKKTKPVVGTIGAVGGSSQMKSRSNTLSLKQTLTSSGSAAHGTRVGELKSLPGDESRRKTRENPSLLDKSLLALTQLCFAINHCREIIVWDKSIVPREILFQELMEMVNEKISKSVEMPMQPDNKDEEISFVRRPSEMLIMLQEFMSVLMNIDKHANIEIVRIFTDVFLAQSQLRDSIKGNPTIVAIYIKWYMDVLMRFAYKDYFVYSPLLRSFVTMPGEGQQLAFRAEDYADLNELKALVEILGPFGMRFMTEAITLEISKIFEDVLKKLVIQNKTTLESLRESVHEPAKTKKLLSLLTGSDELLTNMKKIGILIAFRELCCEAVQDVLSLRMPFLFNTVKDIQQEYKNKEESEIFQLQSQQELSATDRNLIYSKVNEQLIMNDLCLSLGLKCSLDSNLCSAIENRRRMQVVQTANSPAAGVGTGPDQDYKVAYLLFTFIAYALPRLARLDSSFYHIELEAHSNNSHCIAYAINSLMMVLFSRYGHEEIDSREKEFMALTSSNLLRLGLECNSSLISLDSSQLSSTGSSNNNFSSNTNKDSLNSSSNVSSGSNSNNKGQQDTQAKNRYSIYILFDIMTQLCNCLTADLREACFPYSLIRHAYHVVAQQSRSTIAALAHPTQASANAAQIAAGKQIFTYDVSSGISSEHNPNLFSQHQSHSTNSHRSSVAISN